MNNRLNSKLQQPQQQYGYANSSHKGSYSQHNGQNQNNTSENEGMARNKPFSLKSEDDKKIRHLEDSQNSMKENKPQRRSRLQR